MFRMMCKSKIHRATLTKVDLHYDGSMGIDKDLLRAADIHPGEIVQVVNINNGARFETYAIEEKALSGQIGLYGAAAHLGKPGDLVIVFSYALIEDTESGDHRLKVVKVDSNNKLINPLRRNPRASACGMNKGKYISASGRELRHLGRSGSTK